MGKKKKVREDSADVPPGGGQAVQAAANPKKKRQALELAEALGVKKNPWKESDRDKHSPCRRCGGHGTIDSFSHVRGGVCFKCEGSGLTERDWRSDDPDTFTILNQLVQVRPIKKGRNYMLYSLVRKVDFEEYGTPGLPHVGTTFRLVGGDVVGDLPGGLVRVPWPVLQAARPDWQQVMEGPDTRQKRAYLRQERDLSARITAALQAHYGRRG